MGSPGSKTADIEDIQIEFDSFCQKIKPSPKPYRFSESRTDDGFEHIEVGEGCYHIVVTERGMETSRKTTESRDELLYWLVSSFVWGLAQTYELKNRVEGKDFRHLFFAKQIEYLGRARKKWSELKREELDEVVARHPFIDR